MEANIESCKFHAMPMPCHGIGRGRKSLLLSVVPGASPAFRKHEPQGGQGREWTGGDGKNDCIRTYS